MLGHKVNIIYLTSSHTHFLIYYHHKKKGWVQYSKTFWGRVSPHNFDESIIIVFFYYCYSLTVPIIQIRRYHWYVCIGKNSIVWSLVLSAFSGTDWEVSEHIPRGWAEYHCTWNWGEWMKMKFTSLVFHRGQKRPGHLSFHKWNPVLTWTEERTGQVPFWSCSHATQGQDLSLTKCKAHPSTIQSHFCIKAYITRMNF